MMTRLLILSLIVPTRLNLARPLKRFIQKALKRTLPEEIIKGTIDPRVTYRLTISNGALSISPFA